MSIEEARRDVESKRRSFGDEHPETLDSRSHLATELRDAGQYQKAREAVEELIRTRSRLYPNDEYAIQRLTLILGTVLLALGEFSSARILEEGVLEAQDRMYGPDSASSLIAARHLSNALRKMRNYPELANIQQRILDSLLRTVGEGHPDTLLAMSQLAETRRLMGDFESARDLDTMVIEIAERHELNPRTAIEAKCSLFYDLSQLKEYDARLVLLLQIFEESEERLPKDDPIRKRISRARKLAKPFLKVMRRAAKSGEPVDPHDIRLRLPDSI